MKGFIIMKKIISLALALIMICGAMIAFASCEKKGDTLVMATNAAFPPYEYIEDNKIVGIDAEIAKAIADKLGLELEIVDMDFDALIPAVVNGKIDEAMNKFSK